MRIPIPKWIEDKWQQGDPAKKKKLTVISAVVCFVLVLFLIVYQRQSAHHNNPKQKTSAEKYEDLQERVTKYNDIANRSTTGRVKDIEEQLRGLKENNAALSNRLGDVSKSMTDIKKIFDDKLKEFQISSQQDTKSAETESGKGIPEPRYPEPPAKKKSQPAQDRKVMNWEVPGSEGSRADMVLYKKEGGLGTKKATGGVPSTGKEAEKKETDEDSIYLPSSTMMDADVVDGFTVETMQGGKGTPIKVVMRIRDLAILPNEVRVNTEGCFALAEGTGKLSDERVHFRLLKLSCIARDGTAVIDESVNGQLVDMDGHVGLKGNVVTKAGAFIGRAFLANMFEGFGEGLSETSWNVNNSVLGQTKTLKSGDVFKNGIGQGLAGASESVSDYFLTLANQCVPVIESGSSRPVTIQIFDGVDLKIRNKCFTASGCKNNGENRNDAISALGKL